MLRRGLLTGISLLLAPAGFNQTVARKPLPTEPLEKYDNLPAVGAPVLRISPALVSTFGPYTSPPRKSPIAPTRYNGGSRYNGARSYSGRQYGGRNYYSGTRQYGANTYYGDTRYLL